MTATPIPRTLALTLYGDLDVSVLDEMPPGRKQVITQIVPGALRTETYSKIKLDLNAGRQMFVICPRIDEPDPDKEIKLALANTKSELLRMEKTFPDKICAILHSKQTKTEKEKVTNGFYNGKIDILVSTSVVEVGVSVPNATLIIIEGGERFGLAQLHQFRGRVLRGEHQSYCYVFANAKTDRTITRLKSLASAASGFDLAEMDLQMRGAGDLAGLKQWGISDIAMEAVRNPKLVEFARAEAQELVNVDPKLNGHPALARKIKDPRYMIHLE